MPQYLTLAVSQSHTLTSTSATLSALAATAHRAAEAGVHVLLFPEAYLGGYPRTGNFGSSIGTRTDEGREQYLQYLKAAVDLGDTPKGAGDDWMDRKLEVRKDVEYRGDGTREKLEALAKESGVFLIVGVVERAGGSLYCSVVYVCPKLGCIGKRRKVMPTGTERLIWSQGSTSTLRAVTTTIDNVKIVLAAGICWENYMPLLRYSLYSQNVNLYLAPTADARDTWVPLMQTVAHEGRCFVLSSNQCVRRKNLPAWLLRDAQTTDHNTEAVVPQEKTRRRSTITKTQDNHEISWPAPNLDKGNIPVTNHAKGASHSPLRLSQIPPDDDAAQDRTAIPGQAPDGHSLALPSKASPLASQSALPSSEEAAKESNGDDFVCRGGSCIVAPTGKVITGPVWESEDDLLITTVDFEDCERGRLDIDVAGSYSRMDSFELTVKGLDLNPPP